MTRGAMRRVLRRRIDDPEPTSSTDVTQFTNQDLDEILNSAAAKVASYIKAMDPTAFIGVTRSNIVINEDLCPKPQNVGAILKLRKLQDDGTYKTMPDAVSTEQLEDLPADGAVRYAILGRWIQLGPVPDASVANGLEWWFVETPFITAGSEPDDVRVYPIEIGLHNAIILAAEIIMAPEGDNSVDLKGLRDAFQEEIATVPVYYRRTVGREVPLSINLTKTGQR